MLCIFEYYGQEYDSRSDRPACDSFAFQCVVDFKDFFKCDRNLKYDEVNYSPFLTLNVRMRNDLSRDTSNDQNVAFG